MANITQILEAIDRGNVVAMSQLLPLVYDELRRLAASKLAGEKPGQTLQATALVHEVFLRLSGEKAAPKTRNQFFAAAAEAMRRILIEHARRKGRIKRGGGLDRLNLESISPLVFPPDERLLAVDEAIDRLDEKDPQLAEIVKLRFFGGLTMPEVATTLDISLATAERRWVFARTWLFAELSESEGSGLDSKPGNESEK